MKIKDIYSYLDTICPFSTACDFDNVGLLVGDMNATVTKAVVVLDCTSAAVEFARKQSAELIITHHPVIFGGIKSVTAETPVYKAIKNGVSVLAAHTNLDSAEGGVNDILAAALGLTDIKKVVCPDGFAFRYGTLPSIMTADELARYAAERLHSNARYVCGEKPIKTLAVCGGSGWDMCDIAIAAGADAFLTSEVKHHAFLEAKEKGVTLLDLGHFATERVIVNALTEKLKENIKNVEFIPFDDELIKHI